MKKLIALMFCVIVMATVAQAQNKKQKNQSVLNSMVQRAVAAAQAAVPKPVQPVKIAGEKRLITVTLEVMEYTNNDQYTFHRYWNCPAVIFTKDGALAFDGECWQAFEEAAKLPVGPVAHFFVDLGNFGEYITGENDGEPFFFRASYLPAGMGEDYTHGVDEAFTRSADKTYIIYKRSLFNDPTNRGDANNSEVKKAIADYYSQNNLKEVTAENLSKYFVQKHVNYKEVIQPTY